MKIEEYIEKLSIHRAFFEKYTYRAYKYGLLKSSYNIDVSTMFIDQENSLNINHIIEINKITKSRWLKRKLERSLNNKEVTKGRKI